MDRDGLNTVFIRVGETLKGLYFLTAHVFRFRFGLLLIFLILLFLGLLFAPARVLYVRHKAQLGTMLVQVGASGDSFFMSKVAIEVRRGNIGSFDAFELLYYFLLNNSLIERQISRVLVEAW